MVEERSDEINNEINKRDENSEDVVLVVDESDNTAVEPKNNDESADEIIKKVEDDEDELNSGEVENVFPEEINETIQKTAEEIIEEVDENISQEKSDEINKDNEISEEESEKASLEVGIAENIAMKNNENESIEIENNEEDSDQDESRHDESIKEKIVEEVIIVTEENDNDEENDNEENNEIVEENENIVIKNNEKQVIVAQSSGGIVSSETVEELDEASVLENMKKIEAVLFLSARYLNLQRLVMLTDINPLMLKELLGKLIDKYNTDESAIEIIAKDNMWKMDVKQEYVNMINKLATGSSEFTKAEQETLAVIAYKQPVKQSVVIKIRGNKSYEHIKHFINIGLVISKKMGHTKELRLSDDFFEYFHLQKKGDGKVGVENSGINEESQDNVEVDDNNNNNNNNNNEMVNNEESNDDNKMISQEINNSETDNENQENVGDTVTDEVISDNIEKI